MRLTNAHSDATVLSECRIASPLDTITGGNGDDIGDHVRRVCHSAGLDVMSALVEVVRERAEIGDSCLAGLSVEVVTEMYESIVGPAVDRLEAALSEALCWQHELAGTNGALTHGEVS